MPKIKLLSNWDGKRKGTIIDVSQDDFHDLVERHHIAEKAPDEPPKHKMMTKNKVKRK